MKFQLTKNRPARLNHWKTDAPVDHISQRSQESDCLGMIIHLSYGSNMGIAPEDLGHVTLGGTRIDLYAEPTSIAERVEGEIVAWLVEKDQSDNCS